MALGKETPIESSIVGQLRVLVLSSSLPTRSLVRTALSQEALLACQIADCERIESARAQVLYKGFDLVVLDTTLEDVRWLSSHAKDAAIVFLSQGDDPSREEVVAHGAIDCFSNAEYDDKPDLLWVVLRQSIRYHAMKLQRRQLSDALRERDTQVVQLTQRLWRIAPYDYRTGWLAHRHILDRLGEELSRARRYRLPLTVVMTEFDGLAELEEKHGAAFGGRLMAQLAQRMRVVTRNTDLIGHYEIDGCLGLLTNTDLNGGIRFCERLSKALQEPIAVEGTSISLNWRFGVVEHDLGKKLKTEELLALAEQRLDHAKQLKAQGAVVAD